MAPNRFFTGSTSFSMRSASIVSARMLPMIKAPKADEKPTFVEMTAMAQHSPSDTMSSTSLLISLRTERRNSGIAKMPTTSHSIRKKPILRMEPNIWLPSGLLPLAMADSMTIMTMAKISSRIRTDITNPANCCCRRPRSSKALYIIVVDDMANIPPRKMLSIWLQPKAWPTTMPSIDMQKIMVTVEIMGEAPIFRIFLNEKSRPKEKSRNMTPMSAHRWIFSWSTTEAV